MRDISQARERSALPVILVGLAAALAAGIAAALAGCGLLAILTAYSLAGSTSVGVLGVARALPPRRRLAPLGRCHTTPRLSH